MSNVSIKRRFISIVYDTLLILSLMFLGTIPFIALRYGEAVEGRSFDYQLTLFLIIFLFLVGFWSISGEVKLFVGLCHVRSDLIKYSTCSSFILAK